jgi:hypothetical protein
MPRTYRRPGGFAVLAAAVAIGLAACSSGSSTPQVASLGTSSTGNGGDAATTQNSASTGGSTSNPTQLLNEWTACMHSHGDPDQTDPTIDTNKDIHIPIPSGVKGLSVSPEAQACNSYLTAASKALGGGQSSGPPNPKLVEFAECMRDNGVPNFPDPTGTGFELHGLDVNSLAFQNANEVCKKKIGPMHGTRGTPPPPGTILFGIQVQAGNGGLGANG